MKTSQVPLPLDAETRIDQLSDQFEEAWRAGRPLAIEELLSGVDADQERSWLLRRLLEVELELRGRRQLPADEAEYRGRFSAYEDVVAAVFRASSAAQPTEGAARGDASTLGPRAAETSRSESSPRSQPPSHIGRFEVSEMLGSGAFGTVYRARDPKLGREVAIKVPSDHRMRTTTDVQRFLREARAAAAIHHANICAVHEVGDDHGRPFIVMAYIVGESLAATIKRGAQGTTRPCVQLLVRLADAVAAAHQQGVVHRDLKPSNIMIHAAGEPVITDFGLAYMEAAQDATITTDGDVLGSPAYMSPEQAKGLTRQIGPASDIYSLGVILFELLSGERPYRGSVQEVVAQLISAKASPRLAKRIPNVDPELDAICAKAMSVDPGQRFASASEFAGALKSWLQRAETRIPPPRRTSRTIGLIALSAALLLFAAGTIYVQTDQGWLIIESHDQDLRINVTRDGRDVALIDTRTGSQVRLKSGQYELTLRGDHNDVQLSKSQLVMTRGDRQIVTVRRVDSPPTPKALERTDAKSPDKGTASLEPPARTTDDKADDGKPPAELSPADVARRQAAREAWSRLQALANAQIAADPTALEAANVRWQLVQFTRLYGDTPESAEALDTIARFRWPADQLRREDIPQVELDAARYGDAVVPPPAELVAILGDSRWKHWHVVTAIAATSDGRRVASASEDGVAIIWDAEAGRPLHWLSDHTAAVRAIAFSPDNAILATAGDDRAIRCWDVASGKPRRTWRGHSAPVTSIAFDPLGKRLASASRDGTIGIWDLAGNELLKITAPAGVNCVAFSPDGQQLAAGGDHDHLRIWNPNTGEQLAEIAGHKGAVSCVTYSANGALLGSGDSQGAAQVWNVVEQRLERRLEAVAPNITSIAFDRDGIHVVLGTSVWNIHTYELASGRRVNSREFHAGATAVTELPQRRVWLSGWSNHWILRTDKETGEILNSDAGPVLAADMSWDGTSVVGAHREKQLLTMWRLAEPNVPRHFSGDALWDTAVTIAPDGQRLVSAGGTWVPKLWDPRELKFLRTVGRHDQWIWAAAYHPDGARVATAGFDRTVRIWDMVGGECLHTLSGHANEIHNLRFSHDGRWLASACFDQSAKIWDVATGALQASFAEHPGIVHAATFSPNGQLLATASHNSVWLRSLRDGTMVRELRGHTNVVVDADFSPDGRWLASAGIDGTVRIWDYRAGRELKVIRLHPRNGIIHTARFTPDGRHLWTRNGNGTLYVLRLDLPVAP